MKTYPYLFNKLFCQPTMLLEPVRLSLESALLGHMGLLGEVGETAYRQERERMGGGMAERRAEPGPRQREFGGPGRVDENTISYWKMQDATKRTWRVERIYQEYDNVAVVTIEGVIDKHLSSMDLDCYGGCDLADVDQALAIAANDDDIEVVVLNVNSPGGSVLGVPETAARVKALTATKQVHAFVDGMACSAAYYIASQADRIDAAPSAILGSVGVYCAVLDQTKALEKAGLKVELIKAGKYKAMGASFKELQPEEREMMQERVDALHADFRAAVQASRPQVKNDTMEGQTFDGKASVKVGLCDGVTNANLDEYVSGLLAE